MKQTKVFIIANAFLIVSCSGLAVDLMCYQCAYGEIEGLDESVRNISKEVEIPFDKSCQVGQTPSSSLLSYCTTHKSGTSNNTCMILNLNQTINDKHVKLTVRGCFSSINVPIECKSQKFYDVAEMFPPADRMWSRAEKMLLSVKGHLKGSNPDVETCFCDYTNCNSTSTQPSSTTPGDNSAVSLESTNVVILAILGIISFTASHRS